MSIICSSINQADTRFVSLGSRLEEGASWLLCRVSRTGMDKEIQAGWGSPFLLTS